jgi:hypothetical protein
MSIPRQAQLRQLQALNRQKKLEENANKAISEDRNGLTGRFQRDQPRGFVPQAGGRFAATNRRFRDPNQGLITQSDWEIGVSSEEDKGTFFRRLFYLTIVGMILLLTFFKYDVENNLVPPQIESGAGFAGDVRDDADEGGPSEPATKASPTMIQLSDEEIRSHLDALGIKKSFNFMDKSKKEVKEENDSREGEDTTQAEGGPQTRTEREKQRRRDNYHLKQELKKAYQTHQEGYGQLVHCGRACEAEHMRVEVAYTTLASQVDRELYNVLLDGKEPKAQRRTTPEELRAAYEQKKKEIQETEANEEDRNMALEEVKDAYDILSNPEARAYYHLYGMKPPERMKYVSQRHGGWGQEMQLGTYKYRIILAWLDYLGYGESIVLGAVVVFILMRIPQALKQTEQIMRDFDLDDSHDADQGSSDAPDVDQNDSQ